MGYTHTCARAHTRMHTDTHTHTHTHTQNKRRKGVGTIAAKQKKKKRPVAMVVVENRYTKQKNRLQEQIADVLTGNTDKPSHPTPDLFRPRSQLTHVTKKFRANGLCRAKDLARTSILWSFRIEKQELASL